MKQSDVFFIIFIIFGFYCLRGIKKDYVEYKKSRHYLELNIFLRNLGVIIGSIAVIIYKVFKLF